MSLEYAELAVKELTKLHGLSYVLENRRPKYYERKIKTISQPNSFNDDMMVFIENMCRIATNNLENKESQRKFEGFVPNFMKEFEKFVTQLKPYKFL